MPTTRSLLTLDTVGPLLGGVGCVMLAGVNALYQWDTDGAAEMLRTGAGLGILGAALGTYFAIIKMSLALHHEPLDAAADLSARPSEIPRITMADILVRNLSFCLAVAVALGTGALAMRQLTETALKPGPFALSTGDVFAVAGFALCFVGALLQSKARQNMLAQYVGD